jgi:hypothetical protein
MKFRAATVVMTCAVLLLPQGSALGYPQDPNNCNDRTITYYFNVSDWTGYPTQRTWARAAIDLWEQPLDYGGARLMTMTDLPWGSAESGAVDVGFANMAPNEYGVAGCTLGAYVELNDDYKTDQQFIWKVVRHEMGHLAGFEHSGSRDSWNGDDPGTMSTCILPSQFPTTNRLAQDDAAYANWSHSVLANRQLQANFGFEQGTSYWGVHGGTLEWLSTGGATGHGNVRYKTNQGSYYLYQTVNVATGDDDETYRAVINYKQASTGGWGTVAGTLYRKQIDYVGDNGCEYADGLQNLNTWNYVSSAYVAMVSTGEHDPTTTADWALAASGWFNPQNADGYTFQYRIYSHSQDFNFVPQWVYLDNLRAEGT